MNVKTSVALEIFQNKYGYLVCSIYIGLYETVTIIYVIERKSDED